MLFRSRAAHARSQGEPGAASTLAFSPTQVDATRDDPDAADLFAAAQERGYANRFITQALTTPWRPARQDALGNPHGTRLQAAPRLEGLQIATVCGPDGSTQAQGNDELYTDGHGRIRLKFGWDSAQRVTPWVRVARRYAGAGQGWQAIPRIGQEVLVRFLEGDIDRPIVVGTVYNGQGEAGTPPTPNGLSLKTSDPSVYTQAADRRPSAQGNAVAGASPAWHGASPDAQGHRNPAALSGLKSAEFGSGSGQAQGYNQLVLDDTDQQLRVQLASTQGDTQHNLGAKDQSIGPTFKYESGNEPPSEYYFRKPPVPMTVLTNPETIYQYDRLRKTDVTSVRSEEHTSELQSH